MSKMAKPILPMLLMLFISISLMLSLCGCFNSRQLSERALVQAIGIDFEDNKYNLTFQIFSPTGKGGEAVKATSENAVVLQSKGDTISEAFQNATLLQGKELFIGHSRILILGEELAKSGIDIPLGFFSANARARQNMNLAVTKGKASDILSIKINQGILPAETLEKILENGKENGLVSNIKLYEFLASLKNKHECAVLPVLSIKKQGDDEKSGESDAEKIQPISSVEAYGMAIFKEAKLIDIMQNEEAQGLLWIRNAIDQTAIIVNSADSDDMCALNIYSANSKLVPSYGENGEITFSLNINCQAGIGEHQSDKANMSESTIADLERAAGEFIKSECVTAFEKAVTQNEADIFNFGNIVCQDNAKLFKEMRDDWLQTISSVKLNVNTRVKINRVGLTAQ